MWSGVSQASGGCSVDPARVARRARLQVGGGQARSDDQADAHQRHRAQRIIEQPHAEDAREHDAQVLQAGIGERGAEPVGRGHQRLRHRGQRADRQQQQRATQRVAVPAGGDGRQHSAEGGATDREVKHHAHVGLAGAAERSDLQVGHGGQHAGAQARQAIPGLFGLHRGSQHHRDTGKARPSPRPPGANRRATRRARRRRRAGTTPSTPTTCSSAPSRCPAAGRRWRRTTAPARSRRWRCARSASPAPVSSAAGRCSACRPRSSRRRSRCDRTRARPRRSAPTRTSPPRP